MVRNQPRERNEHLCREDLRAVDLARLVEEVEDTLYVSIGQQDRHVTDDTTRFPGVAETIEF